ncbi:MAG: hypothetical protein RIS99_896 [Bacteroidota bacterium]
MLRTRVKQVASSTPWWINKPNPPFTFSLVDEVMSYSQEVLRFIHRFMNGKNPLFRSFGQPLQEQKQKHLIQPLLDDE